MMSVVRERKSLHNTRVGERGTPGRRDGNGYSGEGDGGVGDDGECKVNEGDDCKERSDGVGGDGVIYEYGEGVTSETSTMVKSGEGRSGDDGNMKHDSNAYHAVIGGKKDR